MKKKKKQVKYGGFKAPVITEEHYLLGGGNVPQVVLQPDMDWSNSFYDEESQRQRNIETWNCTGEGTVNAIQALMYRLFGVKVQLSKRWVGIIAGTKEGGNDPHTVCEAIRKYGLIPESMLPFSDDIQSTEEYFSFKGADREACYQAGRDWLAQYNFGHEWVFSPTQPDDEKINNMKIALKYSPLGLSVYAWAADQRGIYVALGAPNHWTSVYAFQEKDIEKIFDSYDPYRKLGQQVPMYCKRFHIEKKLTVAQKKSLWQLICAFLFGEPEELKKLEPDLNPDYMETKPKYDWSTPETARHACRVIADEEGLTVEQKNLMSQVIHCESNYNPKAVNLNRNKSGKVVSTDNGIAQWNDFWHGKEITPDEALNNPEKAVRLMCQYVKKGQIKQWVCFSSGLYQKYTA